MSKTARSKVVDQPSYGGVAANIIPWHRWYFPALHSSQESVEGNLEKAEDRNVLYARQPAPGSMATRSPTLTFLTLDPTT